MIVVSCDSNGSCLVLLQSTVLFDTPGLDTGLDFCSGESKTWRKREINKSSGERSSGQQMICAALTDRRRSDHCAGEWVV